MSISEANHTFGSWFILRNLHEQGHALRKDDVLLMPCLFMGPYLDKIKSHVESRSVEFVNPDVSVKEGEIILTWSRVAEDLEDTNMISRLEIRSKKEGDVRTYSGTAVELKKFGQCMEISSVLEMVDTDTFQDRLEAFLSSTSTNTISRVGGRLNPLTEY